MDDFEQAVRVIFTQDQSISPSVREQAQRYCDTVKARPDGWRFCWERFQQSSCLEVRFWCLQLLPQVLPSLPLEARAELREKLLGWLREVAPGKQEELVVRNKLAIVYVVLLRLDYLASWRTGWRELVALLDKGPNLVDFFLRVLAIFDQEVISDEVPKSSEERQYCHQIKHAMRESDVAQLVECWYKILTSFKAAAPQLVNDCLKAIGVYIVWIEITMVADDRFLTAICSLISEAGPCSGEACTCLASVVSKKMPAGKKVQMLTQLQMLRRLEGCIHQNSGPAQLLEEEAKMLNSIGEDALEAYVDLRVQNGGECAGLAQNAWEFVKQLMSFVFCSFSNQEHSIADRVEPFLTEFFVKVKSFVSAPDPKKMVEQSPCHTVSLEEVRPILTKTLQLIIQRIAYPEWFQHDDPSFEDDERHVAFVEFRRSLTKIYKRIFLVDELLGFQFVQASLAQLAQGLASVRPSEVEAVLYLFREAGETVKDLGQHLQAQGPLAGCFIQLLECDALVKAEHGQVQMALMELHVKYGKIFALHAELFPRYGQRVLQSFVGPPTGIRSSDPRVVSRACFMFARFVKLVKTQVAPLAPQIYAALQDLLVVQFVPSALLPVQAEVPLTKVAIKGALKADDQACLYEALASLVACSPAEGSRAGLEMLLKSPAGNLSEILGGASAARSSTDMPGFAGWAGRSIEAMGEVSKAFTTNHADAAPIWEEVLAAVARILEKFSGQLGRQIGLWKAALFLCRRMVEVLKDRFLGPLDSLLPFLYACNDPVDLTELTVFAHHLVCQYQQKSEPLMQKWLHQMFLQPLAVWQQMPEGSEQLKRERLELSFSLLQLLKEGAQRCPAALLKPMLSGPACRHGQEMMNFLLIGLQDSNELKSLTCASGAWAALLDTAACPTPVAAGLCQSPSDAAAALAALPVAQVLQRLLWSVARMDYNDVQSQKVLGEAASVLRAVTNPRAQPQEQLRKTMDALQQALIGALPGLRNDASPRRLCETLGQDAPLKDVRMALQQCAVDWRRDCG
eukprot:TRINITY_DN42_c0_g2_i1.p1 TRINITY_DN42_c0_g2~~TRINITY_DN42_c0_g2_i1.p1  ORF type:complete len:1022 (-),score=209.04 TRINITY_DN42_c0_g2_i1:50-3115(-)